MQQDRRRQRGRETPINKRAYKTVAIINILIPISEGRQQILYHKHYWHWVLGGRPVCCTARPPSRDHSE